jgi:hypothetical protein
MAFTDRAAPARIRARPKEPTPAVDLKGWTRFLSWIFLTDCGLSPCPRVRRLVAVPQPLTDEQRDAARRAYLKAVDSWPHWEDDRCHRASTTDGSSI